MQTGRYYVVDQIEQAFYDLMKEKDYTNITVTDIIKRAQVSRASFYRHFNYMQNNGSLTKDMSPEEKYRLYARSGLINSILLKWLADGKEESVEEIVNQILRFIMLF